MDPLLTATAAIPEFSLAGKTLPAKVVQCYDGDTFHAVVSLEGTLWKFACRVAGYDTPEMKPPKNKPDRDMEKARALKAKHALLTHVCSDIAALDTTMTNPEMDARISKNTRLIEMQCMEFDKYGRVLVDVVLPEGPVSKWMVEKGYGYAYDGGTKNTTFATKA
jgi:endonuclease YncB( thermonuclease family)